MMNYLQYLQEGGRPVKKVEMDRWVIPWKTGYLITDDSNNDSNKAYENTKNRINSFKEDSSVPNKNTSGNVVGIVDGIAYFGDTMPSTNRDNYVWTNKKANNRPIPNWIQFKL